MQCCEVHRECLKIPEGVELSGESFCKIGVGGRVKVKVKVITLEQATKAQR
jgi:hypothetical protein